VSHIQQAADVIGDELMIADHPSPHLIAAALAAAGLLVTPEELRMRQILAENPRPNVYIDALLHRVDLERAVLDAADKWLDTGDLMALHAAVDALRAATPKDDA
jgi:hypothetical protein